MSHSTVPCESPPILVDPHAGPLYTTHVEAVPARIRDRIKGWRTFFTGVFAGGALLFALSLSWIFYLDANVPLLVANAIGLPPALGNFVFGCVLMLVGYGLAALAYGWGFERVGRANVLFGVAFSIVHAVIVAALLAFVMWVHPAYPSGAEPPGLWRLGLSVGGAVYFTGLHVLFGAIVGAIYETRATTLRARSEIALPNRTRLHGPVPHLFSPGSVDAQPTPPLSS